MGNYNSQYNKIYADTYWYHASKFAVKQCPLSQDIIFSLDKIPQIFTRDMYRKRMVGTGQYKIVRKRGQDVRKEIMKSENYVEEVKQKDNTRVVMGSVQSGKTKFEMSLAILSLTIGKSCIIILNNKISDRLQLEQRFTTLIDIIGKKSEKSEIDVTRPYRIQIVDTSIGTIEYINILTGITPTIIIALGNSSQLGKINKAIGVVEEKCGNFNYTTIVDEADLIDTECTQTSEALENIKFKSSLNTLVSATIIDPLIKEHVIRGHFFQLPAPEGYRGILSYQKRYRKNELIFLPDSSKSANKNNVDPFTNDTHLKKYLKKFSAKEPMTIDYYNQRRPRMTLLNIGKATVPQLQVFQHLKNNYPKKIVAMIFNGNGIILYHKNLPKSQIVLKTILGTYCSSYDSKKHIHTFKNTPISDVIQYLKNNGGVRKFPRIAIISGNLASRGISFVSSDYGKYMWDVSCNNSDVSIGWRLTELYYLATTSTNLARLHQEGGRGCIVVPQLPSGEFPDNDQVRLYCTRKTHHSLLSAVHLQQDLIYQADTIYGGENIFYKDSLKNVTVYRPKVPTGRKITQKVSFTLNITNSPELDKGFELKNYCDNDGKTIIDIIGENAMKKYEAKNPSNILGKGLETVKYAWEYKPRGLVHKIIKAFVTEDFRALTVDEIRKIVRNKNMNISNYDHWGTHNQYKIINKNPSGKYILNPVIFEYLGLVD